MKICYIAHPIAGQVENNLAEISKIVRDISLNIPDVLPFVPYYSDVVALNDSDFKERAIGISHNVFLLKKGFIDELWLYGPRLSSGMEIEVKIAKENNIKVVIKTPYITEKEIELV